MGSARKYRLGAKAKCCWFAMLCYVGGWISGIIFLILEQKNRWVRFHAAQSVVVFGIITLARIILGWIPVVGDTFSWIISAVGFIFWIILMVKAYKGERCKLPWAGEIAEKIIGLSVLKDEFPEPPTTPTPPDADLDKRISDKVEDYFKSRRGGRITASAFAIAWSIVLLIFFNFFNQYVAYYHSETVGNVTTWTRQPFFTEDINLWLPILTTALIMAVIGHVILIIFDKYILREVIHIVIDAFGFATVVTLLSVFPFDFSVLPNNTVADATHMGVTIALIFISIGIVIGILVRLIKLIVNVAKGNASY